MKNMLTALRDILDQGSVTYGGRNGGTISLYGTREVYPAEMGAPIPTTKKVNPKTVATELEWFLRGEINARWLQTRGVKIWDEWDKDYIPTESLIETLRETYPDEHSMSYGHELMSDPKLVEIANSKGMDSKEAIEFVRNWCSKRKLPTTSGYMGPIYGQMLRDWPTRTGRGIDQVAELDRNLRILPMSRRHVISLWNPELLPDESKDHTTNIKNGLQVLPPCHMSQQVMIEEMSLGEIAKHCESIEGALEPLVSNAHDILDTVDLNALSNFQLARLIAIHSDEGHLLSDILEMPNLRSHAAVCISHGSRTELITVAMAMEVSMDFRTSVLKWLKSVGIRTHRVHLQFYMRSNDAPLGRPFNVFSYYLLKELIAKVHNFVSGDLIHNTGVAHIYVNQVDAVMTQLSRTPTELPTLKWLRTPQSIMDFKADDFELVGYDPQPFIHTPVSL